MPQRALRQRHAHSAPNEHADYPSCALSLSVSRSAHGPDHRTRIGISHSSLCARGSMKSRSMKSQCSMSYSMYHLHCCTTVWHALQAHLCDRRVCRNTAAYVHGPDHSRPFPKALPARSSHCEAGAHPDGRGAAWLKDRSAARIELLNFCQGDWKDADNLIHYCSITCSCHSRQHAIEKLCSLLDRGFLNARPPIPAVNRWNKLFAPMTWWCFAVNFHSLASQSVIQARELDGGGESEAGAILDFVGPECETIYRLKKQLRRSVVGVSIPNPALTLISRLHSIA